MAHEVAHVGADVGRRVEGLVVADAGPRVAVHVADGVAAALARGEAGVRQLADRLGGVAQRDVVQLHVLPRRHVALVERGVLLDDGGERIHLVGRDAAERQLHPDHLDVGLALAVDALLEAEADEVGFGRLAVEELLRLVVEVVELTLDDRDDAAGAISDDLRVLSVPRRRDSREVGSMGVVLLAGRLRKRTREYTQTRLDFDLYVRTRGDGRRWSGARVARPGTVRRAAQRHVGAETVVFLDDPPPLGSRPSRRT